MYFVLSKLFWLIFAPSSLVIFVMGFAFVLTFAGRRTAALGLFGFSFVFLAIVAFSPLVDRLAARLEDRFPATAINRQTVAGVIVLGGGIDLAASEARDRLVMNAAGERLVALADLARRYPDVPIVFTGGSGTLWGTSRGEADIVKQYSTTLGVDPRKIIFERASRNTVENALFTRDLVKPERHDVWLLVTSALHMPRAMGIFRHAGFTVIAYPVDYRTMPDHFSFGGDEPASARLRLFDATMREIIGLGAAYLNGQSEDLFPAP